MAYELGPTPDIYAGELAPEDIAAVGPGVASYGIGDSPDTIAGQLLAADIQEVDTEPPTVVEGKGALPGAGWLSGHGEAIAPVVIVEGSGVLVGAGDLSGSGVSVAVVGGLVLGDGAITGTGTAFAPEPDVMIGTGRLVGAGYLSGEGEAFAVVIVGTGRCVGSGWLSGRGESIAPVIVEGAGRLVGAGWLSGHGAEVEPTAPEIRGPVRLELAGADGRSWAMKRGDLLPPLEGRILDRDNRPIDITGCRVRILIGRPGRSLMVDGEGVVVDGPQGHWRYDWQDGDTDIAATYRGEIECTFPGGKRLTAPGAGYFVLRVVEDLG